MIQLSVRRASLVAFAFTALALTACGKTKLDNAKLEGSIKTGLEAQVKDAKVKSVHCPADKEATPGATFECHVEDEDGTKVDVAVTVKDADGNVDWKLIHPGAGAASSAK